MRRSTIQNLFAPQLTDEKANEIEQTIRRFHDEITSLDACYIPKKKANELRSKWLIDYKQIKAIRMPSKHPLRPMVKDFYRDYEYLDKIIATHNAGYIASELGEHSALLDKIDGSALDQQQRYAIVSDEDRNLIVAGAGSGKTLTIVGKAKYLCEAKNVAPEDILLIAFTRKAAEEMADRVSRNIGAAVHTTTFHKLGLDIITGADGKRPDVVDDIRGYVKDYFERELITDKASIKKLVEYFSYYIRIPADIEKYATLGAAYEAEKTADLETLKGKYEQAVYLQSVAGRRIEARRTLRNEQVKSIDEVSIANFLFLNGIEYEYERVYPVAQYDSTRKAYRPDFYLPEYGIYIEHFGINRDGKLPWLSPVEEAKYQEGMRWKRQVHKAGKTTLIETYSYNSSEGRLLETLQEKLTKHGVKLRPRDFTDVFDKVYTSQGDKYFSSFVDLCSSFISLFKSRGYTVQELKDLKYHDKEYANPFHRKRTELFLEIVRPVILYYEQQLAAQHAVDFSDMINTAAAKLLGGYRIHPYKWVIVDEYQDVSVAQYRLLKGIVDQTGAKLFCVGDDWQSIYRFAGSDISMFTQFENHFGASNIMRLEHVYRSPQELTNEAADFIMKNRQQFRKELKSDKRLDYPLVFMCYGENANGVLKKSVDKIIHDYSAASSILLLGRTNYDADILERSGMFHVDKSGAATYINSPETPMTFLSVHRAKGLEADNVVLLNFENSDMGFPNKIEDDPLLELVLTEGDHYPYAEERRLFYVALTRTKNRIFVLVNSKHPSEFLKEFKPSKSVFVAKQAEEPDKDAVMCPKCMTGRLVLRKNTHTGQLFVGCTNYPRCDFTLPDPEILQNPKRCPKCGGFLAKKRGPQGTIYRCTNYPTCKYVLM